MKKTIKKLGLQREAIRYLTGLEVPAIAGGVSSDTQIGSVCIRGGCPGNTGGVTCNSVASHCASGPAIASCLTCG